MPLEASKRFLPIGSLNVRSLGNGISLHWQSSRSPPLSSCSWRLPPRLGAGLLAQSSSAIRACSGEGRERAKAQGVKVAPPQADQSSAAGSPRSTCWHRRTVPRRAFCHSARHQLTVALGKIGVARLP
jgi:hypothetical protein